MVAWRMRAGAVLAAMALSGCDLGRIEVKFADLPPDELVRRTWTAMESVGPVHVVGDLFIEGQTAIFDARYDGEGSCTGAVRIGTEGAAVDVVVVDGDGYLRGNKLHWLTVGEGMKREQIAKIADRWVAVPRSAEFAGFCDFDELLDTLREPAEDGIDPARVHRVVLPDYHGREAVQLECRCPDGSFAFVAETGDEHRLLAVLGAEGNFDFTEFGEPVEVKAPPADEVVDMSGAAGT